MTAGPNGSASLAARLREHLFPSALVAIADGAGMPLGLGEALAEAAVSAGGVRLLLGWCLQQPVPFDRRAFTDVRAFMGGYALRRPLREGSVRYVPVRLGALPSLLSGPLRPDVLLAGLAPGPSGPVFGTEVAWMAAAAEAGATVLAELNHGLPRAAGTQPCPGRVEVVAEVDRPPIEVPAGAPEETDAAIGAAVAALVPEGATLQVGPGRIGAAAVEALDRPVRIRTGALPDAVAGLAQRGLLLGTPTAAYVTGTVSLYHWADGRSIAARLEETHDAGRLTAAGPFVAVNTALEIDRAGQVNVEGYGGDVIGGVGGHPDFALAGVRSREGLSVLAIPTAHAGRSTLVDTLGAPASTARCDVDVVVTESGVADLRGLSDDERAAALDGLWRQGTAGNARDERAAARTP